jgi:hypothetical protein
MMVNGMMFELSSMQSILKCPSMDRKNLYDLIVIMALMILEGTWS